ncbi:hypothetical protein HK098_003476 [Nowakowskiella sp. JEL0407]|nr:hypothetical protein HK098_003476 [Nowakowskiella sp. JEL0407]
MHRLQLISSSFQRIIPSSSLVSPHIRKFSIFPLIASKGQVESPSIDTSNPPETKSLKDFRKSITKLRGQGSFEAFKNMEQYNFAGVTLEDVRELLQHLQKLRKTKEGLDHIKYVFNAHDVLKLPKDDLYFKSAIRVALTERDGQQAQSLLDEAKKFGVVMGSNFEYWLKLKISLLKGDLVEADRQFQYYRSANPDSVKPYEEYMWALMRSDGAGRIQELYDEALKTLPTKKLSSNFFAAMLCRLTVDEKNYTESVKVVEKLESFGIEIAHRTQPFVVKAIMETKGYLAAKAYIDKFDKDLNFLCIEYGMEIATHEELTPATVINWFKRGKLAVSGNRPSTIKNFAPALMKAFKTNDIIGLVQNVRKYVDATPNYQITHNKIFFGVLKSLAYNGDVNKFMKLVSIMQSMNIEMYARAMYDMLRGPMLASSFLTDIYQNVDTPEKITGHKTQAAKDAVQNTIKLYNALNEGKENPQYVAIFGELIVYSGALELDAEVNQIAEICKISDISIVDRHQKLLMRILGDKYGRYAPKIDGLFRDIRKDGEEQINEEVAN